MYVCMYPPQYKTCCAVLNDVPYADYDNFKLDSFFDVTPWQTDELKVFDKGQ